MSNFFLKDFKPSFPLSQIVEKPIQHGQIYLTDFFNHLGITNEKKIREAVELFKPSIYKKGQLFLQQEQVAGHIGLILKGSVELFYTDQDRQQVLFCFTEEDFFTDLKSFLYQVPSKINIEFVENSIVLEVSHEDFKKFLSANPEFGEMFIKIMTNVITTINQHNLMLKMPTKGRYSKLLRLRPHLLNKFPLRTIASFLGVKQETLSRIRGQFRNKVVITTDEVLTLPNQL